MGKTHLGPNTPVHFQIDERGLAVGTDKEIGKKGRGDVLDPVEHCVCGAKGDEDWGGSEVSRLLSMWLRTAT